MLTFCIHCIYELSDDQAFNEVAHKLSDYHPRVSQSYTVPGIFCPGSWRETWGSLCCSCLSEAFSMRPWSENINGVMSQSVFPRHCCIDFSQENARIDMAPFTASQTLLPCLRFLCSCGWCKELLEEWLIKHSCSFKQTPDSTASGHFYVTNEFSLIQFIQLILIRTHAVLLSPGNWQGCC